MTKDKDKIGPPCAIPRKRRDPITKPTKMEFEDVKLMVLTLLDKTKHFQYVKPTSKNQGWYIHNMNDLTKFILVEVPVRPDSLKIEDIKWPACLFRTNNTHSSSVLFSSALYSPLAFKSSPVDTTNSNEEVSCDMESLLMSEEKMDNLDFPREGVMLNKIPGNNKAFALDCEMCKCGYESVLTKFALVDFDTGKTVAVQFVKPDKEITDYLTQYSGVTKEMLDPVTFTLKDAQEMLQNIIGESDILIGHSLENDFRALGIVHKRVVDTSDLFPHVRGLPLRNSLRFIALKYLQKTIQDDSANGHDPLTDANTCIELVKVKMEHGRDFAVPMSKYIPVSKILKETMNYSTTFIGPKLPVWDEYGCADHIVKKSLDECTEAALKCNSNFIGVTLPMGGLENDSNAALYMRSAIERIIEAAPYGTAIEIILGPTVSEIKQYKHLERMRRCGTSDLKHPWTKKDDSELSAARKKTNEFEGLFDIKISADGVKKLPATIRTEFSNTHSDFFNWKEALPNESGEQNIGKND